MNNDSSMTERATGDCFHSDPQLDSLFQGEKAERVSEFLTTGQMSKDNLYAAQVATRQGRLSSLTLVLGSCFKQEQPAGGNAPTNLCLVT